MAEKFIVVYEPEDTYHKTAMAVTDQLYSARDFAIDCEGTVKRIFSVDEFGNTTFYRMELKNFKPELVKEEPIAKEAKA